MIVVNLNNTSSASPKSQSAFAAFAAAATASQCNHGTNNRKRNYCTRQHTVL